MRNLVAFAGIASALTVFGCDGVDPTESGCADTAQTVDSALIKSGKYTYALLELRYSTECRSAWAKVTLKSSFACHPGEDHCATATIVRNSDGKEFSCDTPAGVGTSCYTAQVNDADVSSHAKGSFDNGPQTYFVQTGSYSLPYDPDDELRDVELPD